MYNKENISKEDLHTLLQNGSEFAFETIYKLYYDKLIHISKNYLNSKENAEEITQNVFLKLWQNIDGLAELDNVSGYLFTLTKNACLNFLKHEKIKHKHIESKKGTILTNFLHNPTASLILENELHDRIIQSIELLPEKCKNVFVQSRFEGLKSEEIAKMFAISKRTVDNHIAKGIRHMRLHLKEFTALFIIFFF